MLLIVSGTNEITIDEIGEINEHIQNQAGNGANIIMGVGEDKDLNESISVTVIASGFNIDHKFSDSFKIGATLINLSERSISRKSNYGSQPVNNTSFGVNAAFYSQVPFLTRMVNKLTNIKSDVESSISFKTEFVSSSFDLSSLIFVGKLADASVMISFCATSIADEMPTIE